MAVKENVKNNPVIKWLSVAGASNLFWIFSFSILTAVAAQITVPVKPVPFTLQTMLVVLSGAILGAKKGAYSQFLYLGLGILGLPVFAQTPDGAIGLARILGPTGGYLLAFPLGAFVTGLLVERYKNYFAVVASMFLAEALIILTGTLYLDAVYIHNFVEALNTGAAIFTFWMVIKVFAAASIFSGFNKLR